MSALLHIAINDLREKNRVLWENPLGWGIREDIFEEVTGNGILKKFKLSESDLEKELVQKLLGGGLSNMF